MQKIENAQRKRLATGRLDQNNGFNVPKTEQINHIPGCSQSWCSLWPVNVTQHLPACCAFNSSGIDQVAVNSMQRVRNSAPSNGQISHDKDENNDCNTLIEPGEHGSIKNLNPYDA